MKYSKIRTVIPGPVSKEFFDKEQQYISPGIQSIATSAQITIEKGEGCVIEDADGNRFIDFFAGVGVASLGYNHHRYNNMMSEQYSKIHVGSFTTKNRAELSELLAKNAVGNLTRTQYYSSGAEAVEASLRLAKSYTKKSEFVGFWEGFHGKTLGVVGLLGDTFKHNLGPLPVGRHLTPYANCRRCPFFLKFPSCNWACVEFIRKKIQYETTGDLAAIIAEPIQGTAGNIVPPSGFLVQLKNLAREFGALLIADEMITGFARTGKMFGCQNDGVIPDIITIGKGFGGGFPMTGLMSSEEIIFSKPFANPSGSSSSYGGNPIAATSALATLKIIIDEELVENSRVVGEFMLGKLMDLKNKYPIIGDVRGKGLMIGVELVKNRETNEKLDKKYTQMLFKEALNRGLIMMGYNPDIRINPPLIINKEAAEEGINIFEESLKIVSDRINI